MRRVTNLTRSSIGLKILMAWSGIVLVLFVIVHMLGNLKLFLPPHVDAAGHSAPAIDVYGRFLREMGDPLFPHESLLWVARVVLLACVIVHIWTAVLLTRMGWSARPVRYKKKAPEASTYASRTQRWGGVILAAFIVYHIAHLTLGAGGTPFQEGAVRANMIAGFRVPVVTAFYVIAMVALGLHLYHGTWSLFQTLGASHPRYNEWRRRLALAIALIVAAGNISIPVAVLTGLVR